MYLSEQISFFSGLGSRECDGSEVARELSVDLREPERGPSFGSRQAPSWISWGCSQQISHAHQVVGRRPSEHPAHSWQTSKSRFTHQGHGLEPPEDFFHPLAFSLTHRIARMPSGALVDRTAARPACVLRHMRRDFQFTQRGYVLARVIISVAAQSEWPSLRLALHLHHGQRSLAL